METRLFPRKGNVRSENFQPEQCFPREDFYLLPELPLMHRWHLLLVSELWEHSPEMPSLVARSC